MGKPWRCRLGRYRWTTAKNSDGQSFQTCARCGRDRGWEGPDSGEEYGPAQRVLSGN